MTTNRMGLAGEEALPNCDKDVFANGKSVCLVDIPKHTAEIICKRIAEK